MCVLRGNPARPFRAISVRSKWWNCSLHRRRDRWVVLSHAARRWDQTPATTGGEQIHQNIIAEKELKTWGHSSKYVYCCITPCPICFPNGVSYIFVYICHDFIPSHLDTKRTLRRLINGGLVVSRSQLLCVTSSQSYPTKSPKRTVVRKGNLEWWTCV